MIFKIKRMITTVYYLKFIQVFMRLFYLFRKIVRKLRGFKYPLSVDTTSTRLYFSDFIVHPLSYKDGEFSFLNISESFPGRIDWNYNKHGKLWTYNLTYFNYINQEEISKQEGLELIDDFIEQSDYINDGMEPYPISLRGINWIKFLSKYKIQNTKIDNSLYAQYLILMDNIEYHLLGNHLLENAFSLLFGAYYFQDEKFYAKAVMILTDELEEQILEDGAHFELSPMYHQIMLYRVLDCISLVQNNDWKKQELLTLFVNKAEIMLGWLNTITYENGDIPLLNDSTNNIAPTTKELNEYASDLNVKIKELKLGDSGYRKIINERYEMIIDVGNIGPDYIPGHAHSDIFNFELYIDNKPFIVDTGLSTYETNQRRILERSTFSHNTVEVEGIEQSEVWGAFRMASRAKTTELVEKEDYISAVHNGYRKKLGALHQREFLFRDNCLKLIDTIHSKNSHNAIARLHFYPEVNVEKRGELIVYDTIQLHSSSNDMVISEYLYATEFNKTISAKMVEIKFNDRLELEIKI